MKPLLEQIENDLEVIASLLVAFALTVSILLLNKPQTPKATTRKRNKDLIVLVDMDGVICDFEGYALNEYQRRYPNAPSIPIEKRKIFQMASQYEQEFGSESRHRVVDIIHSAGFFESLPPIPGSVEGVQLLASLPHVVLFFCTSPLTKYDYVLTEKYRWIEKHFGKEWTKRIILTKDKTLVKGDYLIDDKPEVCGAVSKPDWEHIVFSASCNIDATPSANCRKRLHGWATIRDDLSDLF